MKKLFLLSLIVLMSIPVMKAQNKIEDIPLAKPQRTGGMPLYDALNQRATHREFSDAMLDVAHLSNLLWAANGINREDGKRTAPSARNCQEIDIYVYTAKGVYLYVPEKNMLKAVVAGDYRSECAIQPFAVQCPVILVFVANYDKMKGMDQDAKEFYGATDGGYVSQNVYLYCAAENLNTVVLGSIHRDKIQKLLGFNGKAILGQPVGYTK